VPVLRPDHRALAYLERLGVEAWLRRTVSLAAAPRPDRDPPPAAPGAVLAALAEEVAGCQRCALAATRTRAVFGVGDPQAACMVIGEGPGADEDRQGEPFVGRAGRLLNEMLRAIGLEREAVYIANIVKCRPPRNRDPRPEEVAACAAYLERQIEQVAPRVIVALGRVAAQNLLATREPIGRLRGREHRHPGSGVTVVVTYHPAYLLRSPLEKRRAWQDLLRVRARLRGEPPG